jgi:hypothetical protein
MRTVVFLGGPRAGNWMIETVPASSPREAGRRNRRLLGLTGSGAGSGSGEAPDGPISQSSHSFSRSTSGALPLAGSRCRSGSFCRFGSRYRFGSLCRLQGRTLAEGGG